MKKLGIVLAAIIVVALAINYYAYTMVGVGLVVAIAGGLVLKGQSVPAWVLSRQKPIGFGLLGVGLVGLALGASSVSGMKAEHAAKKVEDTNKRLVSDCQRKFDVELLRKPERYEDGKVAVDGVNRSYVVDLFIITKHDSTGALTRRQGWCRGSLRDDKNGQYFMDGWDHPINY